MRFIAALVLFPAMSLWAAERMNVSVCNQGGFPESLIAQAEAEAAQVFRAMDVEVVWGNCQQEVGTDEAERGARFVLRLRGGTPPKTAGQSSLDAMGRSYVSSPRNGYLADVYERAVKDFAAEHRADQDELLGAVIAHELGHLLLGPGHSPHGIMRAPWNTADAIAVTERGLRFNGPQQARIKLNLQERALSSKTSASRPN